MDSQISRLLFPAGFILKCSVNLWLILFEFQKCDHFINSLFSVAEFVFFFHAHFCKAPIAAGWNENRVVAEAFSPFPDN